MVFIEKNEILIILIFIIGLMGIYSIDIFLNIYAKILLFLLILWGGTVDKTLTIIMALILLVIYQYIVRKSIHENFDYLENPLLNKDDLDKVNEIDLNVITPNNYNKNLINKGKNLLNQIYDMKKENELYYDERQKNIIDITNRNGVVLIKSGNNGLQNNKIDIEKEFNNLLNSNLSKDEFDLKLNEIYKSL